MCRKKLRGCSSIGHMLKHFITFINVIGRFQNYISKSISRNDEKTAMVYANVTTNHNGANIGVFDINSNKPFLGPQCSQQTYFSMIVISCTNCFWDQPEY